MPDLIDEAIATASQPQPLMLTLGSTGRAVLLPPGGLTAPELADLAQWSQSEVLKQLVRSVTELQARLPRPTVLDTPLGPVAIHRQD